jgi:predicted outer membrane repeat protein
MSRFPSLLLSALILILPLTCAMPARAADIVVDTSSDSEFFPVGTCRLRDAVEAANTDSPVEDCSEGDGTDRIVFDGVTTITLSSESLTITQPLILDGEGTLVTIRRDPDDSDAFRILHVTSNVPLTLRHIAIENGLVQGPADADGAGIDSEGLVTLEDSRVSGNHVLGHPFDNGGGIYSATDVLLLRSEVSGNSAVHYGGGILADTVTLTDSRIDGNAITGAGESQGGGVFAHTQVIATRSVVSNNDGGQAVGGMYSPALTLRNSTVSGNVAELCGGIAGLVISIQNSTITDNTAGDGVSGGICAVAIAGEPHSLAISNSIVYGNLGDVFAFADPVEAGGTNNIVGTDGPGVTLPPDTLDCDPQLGLLADNGGPTQTHAIPGDSCARDAATNPLDLETDQRGEPRTDGAGTDIGAFELQSDAIFRNGFDG